MAEAYAQTRDVTLANGKKVCFGCDYQRLHLSNVGEFADFSEQECQIIKRKAVAQLGMADIQCGLAAREIINLASQPEIT